MGFIVHSKWNKMYVANRKKDDIPCYCLIGKDDNVLVGGWKLYSLPIFCKLDNEMNHWQVKENPVYFNPDVKGVIGADEMFEKPKPTIYERESPYTEKFIKLILKKSQE